MLFDLGENYQISKGFYKLNSLIDMELDEINISVLKRLKVSP